MGLNLGQLLEHPALGRGFTNETVHGFLPQELWLGAALQRSSDIGADDGLNAIGSEKFDQMRHVQRDKLRILGVVVDDALGVQLQERAPEVCDHVRLGRLYGADGVQIRNGQGPIFR